MKTNANGLLHFDAHFGNILTDGRRMYFTDFGLAASSRFEFSAAERAFLQLNASHDESYAVRELVNQLLIGLSRPAGRRRGTKSAFRRSVEGAAVKAMLRTEASV
ncbi:hypothetical protein AB0B45_47455 [Nonomuraea sp. NPDC049152]|uniref:hypothetical protein n=1 Tax=Nonomuraea sp. NPDC049152 TaxID=3154350 RepID=UPI003407121B